MKFIKKLFGIKSKEEKEQIEKEWQEMKLNLRDKVLGLSQPAVHLLKTENRTNSKFGGKPIVDQSEFEWPRSNGKPMCFLAQFDLNEIAQAYEYQWLNKSGSILFFYDVIEMPWGFDPKDRGQWKVIYQENPTKELEYPSDLASELIVKEKYIAASKIEILPSWENKSIQDLKLTEEEIDLFIEIEHHFEEFDPYGESLPHQVGGFPRPVQGDEMQFECEQASNGIFMGDGKGYKKASDVDFDLAKEKWQLLLQLDSDDELGLMWGDLGKIYFWVERDKAKENNFENTWLVLQCH